MQEKTLFRISLICALIGLMIILWVSETITIPEYKISEINKDILDKTIKVNAKITMIKETQSLDILTIEDETGKIKMIIFKEDPLNLSKGDQVSIQGIVREYKNELEIEASKIITIK